jgi:hypothetical protein
VEIPPDRSMGAVLVRAFLFFSIGFVAAYMVSAFVFGIWRKGGAAANGTLIENAAFTAYVLLVTAVPAAFGFAVVTSPWPAFRELSSRAVAWISGAGGVATYFAQLTGVAAVLYVVPLPAALGPIGAALRMLLPGMGAGAAAMFAIAFVRAARSRTTRPAGPSSG